MMMRFLFELICGVICFVSILFFGTKGYAALAIFALLPIIMRLKKVKPDERELQLFYRTGNVTMAMTIVTIVLIYFLSGNSVNGHLIGNHWMPLSVSSILFVHGLIGTISFARN